MTVPQRPPATGKGSGAQAWREYAAALTDSPVESWSELSREEIADVLEAEGVEQPPSSEETSGVSEDLEGPERPETAQEEGRRVYHGPVWIRPDGTVEG